MYLSRVVGKELLWHMRTAEVQASLRICAGSAEPMLFANVSGRPGKNFRQTTRYVTSLRGLAH